MFKIHVILCPIDFSDASRKAVQYAREFALSMNAKVQLLAIVEPHPVSVDMNLNYIPVEQDIEQAILRDTEAIAEELRAANVQVTCSVELGTPADVILEYIQEMDVNMVIMGSHGKTGLSRLLMGSVAESVMRKAQCPVLIVKAEEREFIGEE